MFTFPRNRCFLLVTWCFSLSLVTHGECLIPVQFRRGSVLMETPGLALQLRLSEELFQNKKCFMNRLIVVKQSEMTTLSFSEKSCMFHCHSWVLWGELDKNKKLLEEGRHFLFSFTFLLYNGKHWSGSWECLGEKGAVEFIWCTTVISKNKIKKNSWSTSLKYRSLFQTPHNHLFSQRVSGKKWKLCMQVYPWIVLCTTPFLPQEGNVEALLVH